MDAVGYLIEISLVALTALLTILAARGLWRYATARSRAQLMWGSGLVLAAIAVAIEAVVFAGIVDSFLLQTYIFCSAAIVGVLSLGATRILKRPALERAYTIWTVALCVVVGVACYLTPISPGIVLQGVISGNPPTSLLILSSLVTFPATVVLLTATALSLKRDRRWQTLLMAAGALILGAGGTLYIASFPIALYYAEFAGIILLFLGLINLPQPSAHAAPSGVRAAA